MLLLVLPLGLTFYAWQVISENDYSRGDARFETLSIESEKALQNRLTSYGNALLGAASFIQGASTVSRAEWQTFVEGIRVRETYPGLNGLAWVQPVESAALPDYLRKRRADGAPGFAVHPQVEGAPNYIVTFLEPESENRPTLGLNIAFERRRLEAANLARDTGSPAISARITLVRDKGNSPAFLMLHPIYARGMPTGTVSERRAALRGWTDAPLTARNFWRDSPTGKEPTTG